MNNKHIFNDTAQLLFNMKRITSTEKAKSRVQEREPPLPLYIGLVIHAQVRSKTLIDKMYQLGVCVS